jgi:large subunit ribosomal protein L3
MLIGRKLGMTQVFQDDGTAVPVTVIKAGPCVVLQKKPAAGNGGVAAIQLGFEPMKENAGAKPQRGHAKKAGLATAFRFMRDMRVEKLDSYELGQELKVDAFQPGQIVDVAGISKGKGFQGVIKRHKHHGGVATHGSMFHRAPGGIGASSFPSRTIKLRGMPGHMGSDHMTVQNLRVVAVYPDDHVVLVRGAVPGATRSMVVITPAVKMKHAKAAAKK